jgi:hypothetical protein
MAVLALADATDAARGTVPGTVTVTVFVTAPAANVYVVVAAGVTRFEPRGETRPTPGSIVPKPLKPVADGGFSMCQTSRADPPGVIVAGCASNVMIRVAGAGAPRPRPAAGGAWP